MHEAGSQLPDSTNTTYPTALEPASSARLGCRFAPLVQMELEEEKALIKARLETWPLPRLVSEGLVLLNMMGTRRKDSYFGKTVINFASPNGMELPFHRFT